MKATLISAVFAYANAAQLYTDAEPVDLPTPCDPWALAGGWAQTWVKMNKLYGIEDCVREFVHFHVDIDRWVDALDDRDPEEVIEALRVAREDARALVHDCTDGTLDERERSAEWFNMYFSDVHTLFHTIEKNELTNRKHLKEDEHEYHQLKKENRCFEAGQVSADWTYYAIGPVPEHL